MTIIFSRCLLLLLWVGLMALVSRSGKYLVEEESFGRTVYRYKYLFAMIVFLPVIWFAATRSWIGDSWVYARTYQTMPDTFSELPDYVRSLSKGAAYYTLAAVIHVLFGDNYRIYFLIIAAIQGITIVWFFRKYSEKYVFSVFLFIAAAEYIGGMCNGIRQFLAVCIGLYAAPYILKKKYIRAILIILIASLFHRSALILLPLLIITGGYAWNARTILYMLASFVAIIFVGRFVGIMEYFLEETEYSGVFTSAALWGDDGSNPLRVAVYSLPAVWSFFARRQIREENDPVITLCVNMSIASMGIWLISMVTSGLFVGRVPVYCYLYSYILLPWEIEHTVPRRLRGSVYFITIALYIGYYLYSIRGL